MEDAENPSDPPRSPSEPAASPTDDQTQPELSDEADALQLEPVPKIEDLLEDAPISEAGMPLGEDVRMSASPVRQPSSPPFATPASGTPEEVQEPTSAVPNYTTKYIMSGHTRSISSVKFHPEGTILASAGEPVT